MLPVQSDCIDTHEDAEDRTKRLYWIGDVEAPRHGAVQFARLQARLAEKDQLLYEMPLEKAKGEYSFTTGRGGKASDCVECRQCEDACPQHLEITRLLKECAAALE